MVCPFSVPSYVIIDSERERAESLATALQGSAYHATSSDIATKIVDVPLMIAPTPTVMVARGFLDAEQLAAAKEHFSNCHIFIYDPETDSTQIAAVKSQFFEEYEHRRRTSSGVSKPAESLELVLLYGKTPQFR